MAIFDVYTGKEKSLTSKTGYTKPKSVELSEDLYYDYQRGDRAEWVKQAVEDRAFSDSIQWDEQVQKKLEGEQKPALPINVTKPSVEQSVSQLTANSPRFMATAQENSDTGLAGGVGELMAYIWRESYGDIKLKYAVRDYVEIGLMGLMAYVDPTKDWGKGEICIADVNPLNLYLDPLSKDPLTQDSPHKLLVETYTGEQILKNGWLTLNKLGYCETVAGHDREDTDRYKGQGQITEVEDSIKTNRYRAIDRYSTVVKPFYRVYDIDDRSFFEDLIPEDEYIDFAQKPAIIVKNSQGIDYITDAAEIKNQLELYEKTGGIYHLVIDPHTQEPTVAAGIEDQNAIPASTVEISPVTMNDLLAKEIVKYEKVMQPRIQRVFSLGGVLVSDVTLPCSSHPIVTQMCHHRRNPYPMGDVRLVKPLQEQLNKIWSLIITNATNSTNIKVFIGRNTAKKKDIEQQFSRAGVAVMEIDMEMPDSKPVIVYPQPLSSELFQDKEHITRQIERIFGVYSFQDGEAQRAPETYRGTVAIDEMSQRRIKSKKDDIEEMLNALGKVVAEYIPKVYTEEKTIRILAPNQQAEEVTFNKWDALGTKLINDLTVGKYDIQVVSGSMLPSNRWARRESYLELWDRGILQDPTIILREHEIPNIEEVIERSDRIKQQAQQLEQMQQMIKDLEGQLQTKSREVIHLQEKVEVEKFKARKDGAEARMESQVQLATARMNDTVKDTREDQAEKKRKAESKTAKNK